MTDRLRDLAKRIQAELHELDEVVGRVQEAWHRAQQASDDFYVDSVALNLHGFYTGLDELTYDQESWKYLRLLASWKV